ncbi:MAG TPA: FAD-dependent oxidoreductase, partial [Bacillota bacterium]
MTTGWDVIVVGAGNAALCAALSAREQGAGVLVLERAPARARGGNSYFTGGLVRFPYGGAGDIRALIPDLTDEEMATVDVGSYPEDDFFEDLARVSRYRADPELLAFLVEQAYPTMQWLGEQGVRFGLARGRQAFQVDGVFRFWGNAPVEIVGGGVGLVDALFAAAERAGV